MWTERIFGGRAASWRRCSVAIVVVIIVRDVELSAFVICDGRILSVGRRQPGILGVFARVTGSVFFIWHFYPGWLLLLFDPSGAFLRIHNNVSIVPFSLPTLWPCINFSPNGWKVFDGWHGFWGAKGSKNMCVVGQGKHKLRHLAFIWAQAAAHNRKSSSKLHCKQAFFFI